MKSTTYTNWFRRLVILGAVIGVGVFASTAGAVGRPPDVQDVAAASLSSDVSRPPDIQAVSTRMSASTADVFERYAAAHPYGGGLTVSDTVVSRPPDVKDVVAQLSTSTPDVFERYAAAHPYGAASSSPSIVSRPPDITDTALGLQYSSGSTGQSQGFDWNDWGIGIGTGLGLALLLGIGFLMSRQHRHSGMQPA
jgi:hypothetical protein